jgi:YD repeat-containing protein
VSLKNGNYFIGFFDIVYSGGMQPQIERVYNSKATYYRGIFGNGWGMEYESYLSVLPEGILLHEYGGGANNVFVPDDTNHTRAISDEINRMIAVQKTAGYLQQSNTSAYQAKLASDSFFRADEWDKLLNLRLLSPTDFKEGATLISTRFGYQTIKKTTQGYTRALDAGRSETFNMIGKLVQVSNSNGDWVKFTYADNHLDTLTDNFGRVLHFTFNDDGLVKRIEGQDKRAAAYWYNSSRDLISSKDSAGNKYIYHYDKVSNLTAIAYSDNSSQQISYYDRIHNYDVKSVKDRDGELTQYSYSQDPHNPLHLTISVDVRSAQNARVSASKYEYFNKIDQGGSEWTERLVTNLDEDITDTTYDRLSGNPNTIVHNGVATSFKYDTKARVLEKETSTELTTLEYDPETSKVSKVTNLPKQSKKVRWSKFQYDGRGNLTNAIDSDGASIQLKYDAHGRIASMTDGKTGQLKFEYNEESKPTQITYAGEGKVETISVKYSPGGDIEKVSSPSGRDAALRVTRAFQRLLDIIRPAGVNLSF